MKETSHLAELLGPGGRRRVLIIEDEAAIRTRLTDALVALGHDVDAREGVERAVLPLVGYDLAFLDNYFVSGSLTGVSLTPELRASCPGVRIVAMSSDAGKNAEMLRLGADVAVTKAALRRLLTRL